MYTGIIGHQLPSVMARQPCRGVDQMSISPVADATQSPTQSRLCHSSLHNAASLASQEAFPSHIWSAPSASGAAARRAWQFGAGAFDVKAELMWLRNALLPAC